jgi:hypothetical protein
MRNVVRPLTMRPIALCLLLSCSIQAFAADPEKPATVAAFTESTTEAAPAVTPAPAEPMQPYVVMIDAPSQKRVIDKKFIWAMTFASAASIADIESTKGFLSNPLCHESSSAWLVGQRPSRARMYLTTAAIQAGVGTLSYYLKKKGKRFWWMPAATLGASQLAAAGWNRFGSTCY